MGISGLQHPGKVCLGRGVGLEIELRYKHVQHGRRPRSRSTRSERATRHYPKTGNTVIIMTHIGYYK